MATRKKPVQAVEPTQEETLIVASTLDEDKGQTVEEGTIAIACCLPFGLRFDDIPDGKGGTKVITLPSLNEGLRGKRTGVLAMPGNAVCVQLPKKDWDALLEKHGREIAFTGRDGRMPCVYPVGDVKGFKSASSEIAEMKHGLEPVAPETVGVIETKER